MSSVFVCPICHNQEPLSIGIKNGVPYCRLCTTFNGKKIPYQKRHLQHFEYSLDYELSKEQETIADDLLLDYQKGRNALVYAVCGAGKTELVLKTISYALKQSHNVAFVVPRKDVVIEMERRFKSIFKNNHVVAIYGGHSNETIADILIMTNHQLYRYDHYFDLIIMDEIDAFPFKNNALLKAFFQNALRGSYLLLSATPSEAIITYFKERNYPIHSLFTRFHKQPIPIPVFYKKIAVLQIIFAIRKLKMYARTKRPCLVFVPTIELSKIIYYLLNIFVKKGNYINSKVNKRYELIEALKTGNLNYLVTTSVLERGVTFANIQLIILFSDNHIYDAATLIQISGRAGRKKDFPHGDISILAAKKEEHIVKAVATINGYNQHL
ncbi:MAG: DEAD/DEAH box helicase family protein [Erysipelotrichaceae bacterium]|jgi:competence protein ComFA|nr:DEAD/DEAH box helicase family protein [Erysipelotrichaceae bacterium]